MFGIVLSLVLQEEGGGNRQYMRESSSPTFIILRL
nr:unnamed protein product [Callosobruchus chinensis]